MLLVIADIWWQGNTFPLAATATMPRLPLHTGALLRYSPGQELTAVKVYIPDRGYSVPNCHTVRSIP